MVSAAKRAGLDGALRAGHARERIITSTKISEVAGRAKVLVDSVTRCAVHLGARRLAQRPTQRFADTPRNPPCTRTRSALPRRTLYFSVTPSASVGLNAFIFISTPSGQRLLGLMARLYRTRVGARHRPPG